MRNMDYEKINTSSNSHLIEMASIAFANGLGVVLTGFILASVIGLSPQQLVMPEYNPPVKILRLSSLN